MQQCIRDSDVQINMKLEAPLVFSNEFLLTRHFRIQCDTKAAEGESYSFIPCRMVYLRQFETLEFVQIKAVTSCSTHKIDQQETDG